MGAIREETAIAMENLRKFLNATQGKPLRLAYDEDNEYAEFGEGEAT